MISQLEITAFSPNGENKAGMHQLLDMLRSLMPVLDNIKNAVENSSSKIPKATEQLSTVTQATESATMEILNLLDDIGRRVEHVQGKLKEIESDLVKKQVSVKNLAGLIDVLTAEQKAQFTSFETDWNNITDLTLQVKSLEELSSELAEVHSLSMNIAMALQVQDITSQQIESVRHQIESVRAQLSFVVGQYEGRQVVEEPLDAVKKSFDADAQYSKDESRQSDADDIIAQFAQINNQ